ncbi:MAG: hypothetical protein ACK41U_14700 [Paracoccus sp. (in: a-proteobacteria)]|uniref:hypothetical protein n=1 Tax=Paracoccus sp. TaxID=267 RepID=UPI00391B4938
MGKRSNTPTARQQLQALLTAGKLNESEYAQALAAIEARAAATDDDNTPPADKQKPRHI